MHLLPLVLRLVLVQRLLERVVHLAHPPVPLQECRLVLGVRPVVLPARLLQRAHLELVREVGAREEVAGEEVAREEVVGEDLAGEQLVVEVFAGEEALLFFVERACVQGEVVGAGGELAGDEAEELDIALREGDIITSAVRWSVSYCESICSSTLRTYANVRLSTGRATAKEPAAAIMARGRTVEKRMSISRWLDIRRQW